MKMENEMEVWELYKEGIHYSSILRIILFIFKFVNYLFLKVS